MTESTIAVTIRIPRSLAERAKRVAAEQERTLQAVYGRALRHGLDVGEEHDRIALEAIEAATGVDP